MTTTTYPQLTATKPQGGFVFLAVQQFCLIWSAYRIRDIQLRDLRAWFACHELVARRCQLAPGQTPTYTRDELHRLVGGAGGGHLRASLCRLEALGLLTWSSATITFATSPRDFQGLGEQTVLTAMLKEIPNPHRRVPVPRQTLRLIAGGCRSAVIATILGHLCRCLYYRKGQCHSGGLCKASWIAGVFGLHVRNIKAARKHLAAIGWLQQRPTPQRILNRWGVSVVVNLAWNRTTANAVGHAHQEAATSHTRCQISLHEDALPPITAPAGDPIKPEESPGAPYTPGILQEDHLPSAPMHPTLSAETPSSLHAAYAMLPEDEQVALRVAATAHLLQQGYKRAFLIEPVIMSAVHTLLTARRTTPQTEESTLRTHVPPSQLSPSESSPRSALSTGQSPPPFQNREPFQDHKNQKPGSARPDGIAMVTQNTSKNLRQPFPFPQEVRFPHGAVLRYALNEESDLPPLPDHIQTPPHQLPAFFGPPGIAQNKAGNSPLLALPPPTLNHIIPEDLRSTDRLLALYKEAHHQHLLGRSDSDRLTFVALAEHATVVGRTNPCGLFAALLRRQAWHFVTDSDEDAAHARLTHYFYGTPSRAAPERAAVVAELSRDATIVRYVQTQLARTGWQGDAFALVSREDTTWTRARWDTAVGELAAAQRVWHQAHTLHRLGELPSVPETREACGVDMALGDRCA